MPDISLMTPLAELPGADLEDVPELVGLGREAEEFLSGHRWCRSIRRAYFADGWAGILGIFYFEIDPEPPADEAVWVIVGDIPPAYLDTETCRDPAEALEGYAAAMWEWVERVQAGEPLDENVIPVYFRDSYGRLEPTTEHADMLASRLKFIEEKLVPELSG
jgi:hypothetical protein